MDRQVQKLLRAKLLATNKAILAQELVELRDILEHRLQMVKGDPGEKGIPGYAPVKGKDYFTTDEIEKFLQIVTPVKGEHYFTDKEVEAFKKAVAPVKGKDYFDGAKGDKGEPGKNGSDANFDPSTIINKIDKLKEFLGKQITVDDVFKAIEERKIEAKFIKGLPDQVLIPAKGKKKIDFSDMRWHGGGGDLSKSGIYTETPSGLIDSSNVTYTVTHTINNVIGFAINGMYIHPAEYSYSGSTITFSSPLDASLSGLSFSITYV